MMLSHAAAGKHIRNLFLVQQQRNNNVIIMVVIMMMYFIIEKTLVQIPPPTVKATPRDPKVGCQFLPGWNCQILQFPSKSINLPSPWAKLLVIREQANPWLMHEAEQSHSAWEQAWLCSADRKRNEGWSLGLAQGWGEHTHVLREQAFTAPRCCSTAPLLQTHRKSWGKLVEEKELVDSVWKKS